MIKMTAGYNSIRIINIPEKLNDLVLKLFKKNLYKSYIEVGVDYYRSILMFIKYLEDNHIMFYYEEPVAKQLKSFLNYEKRGEDKNIDTDVPWISGINVKLEPFQFSGVRFLEACNGNGILGLEVGTGKTLTALAYCIKNNKKAIIICPSQGGKTKKSLEKEIKDRTNKSCAVIWGSTRNDLVYLTNKDFIIINYDLLDKFQDLLINLIAVYGFSQLILDEGHSIKNTNTYRFNKVKILTKYSKGVIVLTGTAVKNNIKELYPLLNLVSPERFNDRLNFIRKYGGIHTWNQRPKSSKEELELLNKDIQGCFFWRDKETILSNLPKTEFIDRPIKLTHVQRNFYEMRNGKQAQRDWTIKNMIPYTIELLKEIGGEGKKTIVYTWYRETCEEIFSLLGKEAVINHGGRTYEENQTAYLRFKQDPSVRIIVVTIKSFGESINVQDVADKEVFNDLPPTPADIEQCVGRISRSGQDSVCKVFIQRFIGTYHDSIIKSLNKKYNIISKSLHNKDVDLSTKIRRGNGS